MPPPQATIREVSYSALPPNAPSPLEFDYFIPWLCRQLRIPEIVRIQRTSYVVIDEDLMKSKSLSRQIFEESLIKTETKIGKTKSRLIAFEFHDDDSDFDTDAQYPAVVLRTFYDTHGNLKEFMIKNYDDVEIPPKIIKCISLCLVFYPFLHKVSFVKCRLTKEFVYEVGNLISKSESYITELCLDNSFVPYLNYYSLVANDCFHLKTISLNNCRINDLALEYLYRNIETNVPNLRSLELARNYITDKGADIIAKNLRTNRVLLHLNLAGNRITDKGALRIMDCFSEFQLTPEEVFNLRKKKMAYFRKQGEEYEKSIEGGRLRTKLIAMSKDLGDKDLGAKDSGTKDLGTKEKKKSSPKPSRHGKSKKTTPEPKADTSKVKSIASLATFKSFKDLFDDEHTVFDKGVYYCTGNLKLCWLNLSYNYLGHRSIKRAYDILLYQNFIYKPSGTTGLLRLVIDGIHMYTDADCNKAQGIKKLLQKAVQSLIPLDRRSFEGGFFRKRRSRKTKLFG